MLKEDLSRVPVAFPAGILEDTRHTIQLVNENPQALALYRQLQRQSETGDRALIHFVRPKQDMRAALDLFRVFEGCGWPYRAPHHSCSETAMVGEVALAATGLLVLHDAADFRKATMRTGLRIADQMSLRARPMIVLQYLPADGERVAAMVTT